MSKTSAFIVVGAAPELGQASIERISAYDCFSAVTSRMSFVLDAARTTRQVKAQKAPEMCHEHSKHLFWRRFWIRNTLHLKPLIHVPQLVPDLRTYRALPMHFLKATALNGMRIRLTDALRIDAIRRSHCPIRLS